MANCTAAAARNHALPSGVVPTSMTPLTFLKATFVSVSINSASAACADDPLPAVMAKRRTEGASTAMAVRKQRLDAMRTAKKANPARQASGIIE
jgi:hypothetical protein